MKHITPKERDKIAIWLAQKKSLRGISKLLGRSVSSISDEIKRNSVNGVYSPISAQYVSSKRNAQSRKQNPRKDKWVISYVEDKLKTGWSPEQISGRLKREYKRQIICHETI